MHVARFRSLAAVTCALLAVAIVIPGPETSLARRANAASAAEQTALATQESDDGFVADGRITLVGHLDWEYRAHRMVSVHLGDETLALEDLGEYFNITSLDYAPDGSALLLAGFNDDPSDRSGHSDIYRLLPSSPSLQRLTDYGGADYGPRYSPGGQRVAFITLRLHGLSKIALMRPDGSNQDVLPYPVHVSSFSWRRDGTGFLFSSYFDPEGGGDANGSDLWTVNDDGTDLARLTNTPGRIEHHPEMSPDGRLIAYEVSDINFPGGLWMMNADGTDQHHITGDCAPPYQWSSDGRWLLCKKGPGTHVVTVRADGSETRTLDLTHRVDPWGHEFLGDSSVVWVPPQWQRTSETEITALRRPDAEHVRVRGYVRPATPANSITLKLMRLRRDRPPVLVRTLSRRLSDNLTFGARLWTPPTGTCRLVAYYAGNRFFGPSKERRRFRC